LLASLIRAVNTKALEAMKLGEKDERIWLRINASLVSLYFFNTASITSYIQILIGNILFFFFQEYYIGSIVTDALKNPF